jgi:hypothetical protein
MSVQLDIAALVGALVLPAVLLVIFLWYRDPLSDFLRELPARLKSVSVAGFSLELATASTTSRSSLQEVKVDLRHAGTPADVNDSTLQSFYEQVRDVARIDYVVVDLGTGQEWLSSRLYILSVILRRMRGLRAFILVQTIGLTRRQFLGVCDADRLRWRLAARWPLLESALAAAELRLWGHPYVGPDVQPGGQIPQLHVSLVPALPGQPPPPPTIPGFGDPAHGSPRIVNDEGRIVVWQTDPGAAAADLLRHFLDTVQRPTTTPRPEWEELPSNPSLSEYAVWLTADLIEDVLDDSLDERSVRLSDLQGWNEDLRLRAILEHPGEWVSVIRDQSVFDRLIDRRQVLEEIGRRAVSQS